MTAIRAHICSIFATRIVASFWTITRSYVQKQVHKRASRSKPGHGSRDNAPGTTDPPLRKLISATALLSNFHMDGNVRLRVDYAATFFLSWIHKPVIQ